MKRHHLAICATAAATQLFAACSSADDRGGVPGPNGEIRRLDAPQTTDSCHDTSSGLDATASCTATSTTAGNGSGGDWDAAASPQSPLTGTVYSASALELFWPRSTSTRAHDVFRDGSFIRSTDGTSHFDSGLAEGTTYLYEVQPVSADGTRSESWELSLTTLDIGESVGTTISSSSSSWSPDDTHPSDGGSGFLDDDMETMSGVDASHASAASDERLSGSVSASVVNGVATLTWSATYDGEPVRLFDVVGSDGTLLTRTTETTWSVSVPESSRATGFTVYAIVGSDRLAIGTASFGRSRRR